MIRLYFKIPENFLCLIFLDGFCFGYIPFGRIGYDYNYDITPCYFFTQALDDSLSQESK